jgi:hypothetical protein
MKLKNFKKLLDKMTPEELNQELLYNSEEYSMSGRVTKIKKASSNLYYLDDDDPAQLFTKKKLLEDGYEKEDIDEMIIEVPKGRYYIEF